MSKAIVLVADRDDAKHGEITVVDDLRKAERLVETLLEAGFNQERIQVFVGNSLGMLPSSPTVTGSTLLASY